MRTGFAVAIATFSVLIGVVATTRVLASDPPGSAAAPLTTEQKATARRVEGMLIAPCCFGGTVADHRSPLSDSIRQRVRSMIAAGATEQQVLVELEAEYGERILAAPRAEGFNIVAYVLPAVGVAVGLLVVLLTARRRRLVETGRHAERYGRHDLHRRLEDELAQIES